MPRRCLRSACFASCLATLWLLSAPEVARAQPAAAPHPAPFTLVDGDRVVLLGATFIERDQVHGYFEAALTSRFRDRNIQFRNLGWSGDNVFGEARAGFGTVADGFEQLKKHVAFIKPSVILLNYGANESFAGQAGLNNFRAGLDVLLGVLDESGARIVFIAPPPQEDLGRPLPDPAAHNAQLQLYTKALTEVAAKRGAILVNLFDLLGKKLQPPAAAPLTDNGLHLTDYGYWRAAFAMEQGLGLAASPWHIDIDAQRHNISASGVRIQQAQFTPEAISFRARDQRLPNSPAPAGAPAVSQALVARTVRVLDLPAGDYALEIDGKQVATGTARQWADGVAVSSGPDFEQAEKLRRTINEKNQLYFHRWRPQNETYLLGFRKHEQGQNAIEIPQFDPLVAEQEVAIHQLAAPVERQYQLIRLKAKQ